MTRRLEELFDLASTEEIDSGLSEPLPEQTAQVTQDAITSLEKIENALPQIRGLEDADAELDELASLATSSFKDLQDLGMQVEARFSSDIFSAAGTMLGHAIAAKTAKINKKLKMVDLQLKKAALDKKHALKEEELDNTPLGEGRALDRNELLKILSEKPEDK